MAKIKFCGLSRIEDIEAVNELRPEYIGFVFAEKSRRYVPPEKAARLKERLYPDMQAVGVFVNEKPEHIARLLHDGIIDIAQLHGNEDAEYIRRLRGLTEKPLIQAFRIDSLQDAANAQDSLADYILLDSGNGGTGTSFDWNLIRGIRRQYFLAGGLDAYNVESAVRTLDPYAVDVSSGIETDGIKDKMKMRAFADIVRDITNQYGRPK